MRIGIAWMGKTKHPATKMWTEEYLGRMRGFARFATVEGVELAGKDPAAALERRAREARLWLCDPSGKQLDSPGWARFMERQASAYNQEMLFAIGGPDGFAPGLICAGRLSLSSLTLSHELARLVLLEQVYRGLAILTNHPYPH